MELLLIVGLIVVGVLIIRVGIKRSPQKGAGEGECQGRHRGTSTETEPLLATDYTGRSSLPLLWEQDNLVP